VFRPKRTKKEKRSKEKILLEKEGKATGGGELREEGGDSYSINRTTKVLKGREWWAKDKV